MKTQQIDQHRNMEEWRQSSQDFRLAVSASALHVLSITWLWHMFTQVLIQHQISYNQTDCRPFDSSIFRQGRNVQTLSISTLRSLIFDLSYTHLQFWCGVVHRSQARKFLSLFWQLSALIVHFRSFFCTLIHFLRFLLLFSFFENKRRTFRKRKVIRSRGSLIFAQTFFSRVEEVKSNVAEIFIQCLCRCNAHSAFLIFWRDPASPRQTARTSPQDATPWRTPPHSLYRWTSAALWKRTKLPTVNCNDLPNVRMFSSRGRWLAPHRVENRVECVVQNQFSAILTLNAKLQWAWLLVKFIHLYN